MKIKKYQINKILLSPKETAKIKGGNTTEDATNTANNWYYE